MSCQSLPRVIVPFSHTVRGPKIDVMCKYTRKNQQTFYTIKHGSNTLLKQTATFEQCERNREPRNSKKKIVWGISSIGKFIEMG